MVHLVPWGPDDAGLLERLVGDPAMMEHLGGPESAAKIADRQQRYVRSETGVFKVVVDDTGEGVGWVGFWDHTWHEQEIYEVGWSVLPGFQGRGIATAAMRQVIALADADGRHRFAHAFPAVANGPSNAVCRKLGFELVGPCEFDYPPGSNTLVNDWRLTLTGSPPG